MRNLPCDPNREPRPVCYRCLRPSSHCLCSLVLPFEAHCNILVIQHPHERKKYHSTVRLLRQAITNVSLVRGIRFAKETIEPLMLREKTYLLYPSKNALDASEIDLNLNTQVVVVDGTWIEARKILYRNPFLRELPCISFRTPLRSKFVIRKQPKDHYLSTLESVAHLLQINAFAKGDGAQARKYQALFDLFARLVETQFAYFPRNAAKAKETTKEFGKR